MMDVKRSTEITEQIKKIYQSEHLKEEEKDRLIAELLRDSTPLKESQEFNPTIGYIVSLLLPPLGFFIGAHYLYRYGEDGYKPAGVCAVLTLLTLLIQAFFFRKILAFFLPIISR